HNIARLADDHANVRLIAERIADIRGMILDLATVQTNIVIFRVAEKLPDAAAIVARAKAEGVLISALGARTVRAVTHLDVDRAQCERAGVMLAGLLAAG
ncbi:MAG: hypothetical protein ACREFB_00800, partial [Stellaceae bacterium]